MRTLSYFLISAVLLVSGGEVSSGQEPGRDASKRMVLVELYTSQGCNMCPEAERLLGALAAQPPDRPDCVPRRLLQRPLEGRLLGQTPRPATDGL